MTINLLTAMHHEYSTHCYCSFYSLSTCSFLICIDHETCLPIIKYKHQHQQEVCTMHHNKHNTIYCTSNGLTVLTFQIHVYESNIDSNNNVTIPVSMVLEEFVLWLF